MVGWFCSCTLELLIMFDLTPFTSLHFSSPVILSLHLVILACNTSPVVFMFWFASTHDTLGVSLELVGVVWSLPCAGGAWMGVCWWYPWRGWDEHALDPRLAARIVARWSASCVALCCASWMLVDHRGFVGGFARFAFWI